jgi:hypothetical protein
MLLVPPPNRLDSGGWDETAQVLHLLRGRSCVVAPVEEQGRNVDRRQHPPQVDLVPDPRLLEEIAGSRGIPRPSGSPRSERWIVERRAGAHRLRVLDDRVLATPAGTKVLDRVAPHSLRLLSPGVVRSPGCPGTKVPEDQCVHAFRERRRVDRRQTASVRSLAEQDRAIRLRSVEDRADVLHPGLEIRRGCPVGQTDPAFVEVDDAEGTTKHLHPARVRRVFPKDLDV